MSEAPPLRDTLVSALLDESGSMGPKQADVLGGFDHFVAEQQRQPGGCRLLLVTFNTEVTVRYPGGPKPLLEVPSLRGRGGDRERAYVPGGNTALFDAIAEAVRLSDVLAPRQRTDKPDTDS